MKALVWTGNNLELADCNEPLIIKCNDVKVKIKAAGICGTDLNIIKRKIEWPSNRIIGHEAVGIVVETGPDVSEFVPGDRVIIDPTQYCGKCFNCRKGLTNFCKYFDSYEVGRAVNGVFTEYYVGEDRFLYKIPELMDWETAILAEPLACVLHYIEEADVRLDDNVLILGGGPIGILCAFITNQIARLTTITEVSNYRINYLKKQFTHVYKPFELTDEKIAELTYSKKFNVVIDTIGNQLKHAFPLVSKGGKIVVMGLDPEYSYDLKPFSLLSNGISIVTFGEYHNYMEKAIVNLEKNIPFSSMVTNSFPLESYKDAFNSILGVNFDSGEKEEIRSNKTILTPNY